MWISMAKFRVVWKENNRAVIKTMMAWNLQFDYKRPVFDWWDEVILPSNGSGWFVWIKGWVGGAEDDLVLDSSEQKEALRPEPPSPPPNPYLPHQLPLLSLKPPQKVIQHRRSLDFRAMARLLVFISVRWHRLGAKVSGRNPRQHKSLRSHTFSF